MRVSFRHSDLLTLPLPPPAGARGPSNRSVHHPHPPGYFHFGGFGPNLCSTKVAPRASQGHRAAPRSPQEDRHFQTFFFVPRVSEKSALLGARSVDSLPLWGVWAKSLFNKDCLQSFPGPPGRAKEPTRAPTFSQNFEKNREPSSGAKT